MKRTGIGVFPCYNKRYNLFVEAKTRDQVIQAMKKKKKDLFLEIAFFDEGLRKIQGLKERDFYELDYRGEAIFLVQCWKFGRDHVEFRIFTRSRKAGKINDNMSLAWHWDWETTPVDPKNATLYVNHGFKTEHYDKLLKGTYRSLNKREFTKVDINNIN